MVFEPNWRKLIPFAVMHVAAAAGVALTPFRWELAWLCIGLYLFRMFGLSCGFHRYFAHRSFKTSRAMQFALAVIGNFSMMRGPHLWVAGHRHHHRHSDTHADIHSPRRGFFWAHCGWFLSMEFERTRLPEVRDLDRYPELRWLSRYYFLPGYALAVLLYLIGGWPFVAWGFLLSTVLTWHITFLINSLAHTHGTRRYATGDTSRNNFLLALLTFGEGWHNNHHHDMRSARHGLRWWEIDLTYSILLALRALGLVWDLQAPHAPLASEPTSMVEPLPREHDRPAGLLRAHLGTGDRPRARAVHPHS